MNEEDFEHYIPKLREIKKQLKGIRNFTSCDKYTGCVYKDICEATPESRDHRIERDFKIGQPWDVARILEAK